MVDVQNDKASQRSANSSVAKSSVVEQRAIISISWSKFENVNSPISSHATYRNIEVAYYIEV